MNKRRFIWKLLLIVGIIPFVAVTIYGISNAIFGFSGLCLGINCSENFGFDAFIDSIILYSYLFWPTYIIGLLLIIISIFKLKK